MLRTAVVLLLSAFVILVTACQDPGLGDDCEKEGSTDGECRTNLICGRYESGPALTCLRLCNLPGDCSATENCEGISNGNLKGCRTR